MIGPKRLDARVLYDWRGGVSTLFLGRVDTIGAASAALRSAADLARERGGTNLRVEMRDAAGHVVLAAKVRDG